MVRAYAVFHQRTIAFKIVPMRGLLWCDHPQLFNRTAYFVPCPMLQSIYRIPSDKKRKRSTEEKKGASKLGAKQQKNILYQGTPKGQAKIIPYNIIPYQGPPQRQVSIVPYQGPPHQVQAQARAPPQSRTPPPPRPALTRLMAERLVSIASGPAPARPTPSRLSAYQPADHQLGQPEGEPTGATTVFFNTTTSETPLLR